MPEGDTIWRLAASLREQVGGRTVTAARPERLEHLAGQTLEAVEPVGKHLLMRFSGGWTLHGHLGPDILAEDFPLDQVVTRARMVGPTALGELLLDQRVCCGIGNVYKCETLWQLRHDPWRSSAELSDEQLAALFATARMAMRSNLGAAPQRRFGGSPAAVHGRRGRPCPRCGAPVRARGQGEQARLTYWCPTCQVS